MRSILIMSALIAVTVAAEAQERRLLTMEEAVLGTGIKVFDPEPEWGNEEHNYILTDSVTGHPCHYNAALMKPVTYVLLKNKDPYRPFTKDGNVWFTDRFDNDHRITFYDEPGIVCGETVSRNEFGIDEGLFLSPDKLKLAFYRKDESRVTLFPLLDITSRTGTLKEIRYPMNGMASEHIGLGVYDFEKETTVWLDVTDFDEERYLTNISWDPQSRYILIQVLDRTQKDMHLNLYDASTGRFIRTLFKEHDDRYVEPQYPLVFLDGDNGHFM